MEKEERHSMMKVLLTAKANNDQVVIKESFNEIINKEEIDWDLLTLILSSIPKLHDAEKLFEEFVEQLHRRNDIPENAYTCIISNYAFYKNSEKAMYWIESLQRSGFQVKNRHLISLIQLTNETNDLSLRQKLDALMDSSSQPINQKVRSEEILLYSSHKDESQVVSTLRNIAKTDRYITDSSVIKALEQFCNTNPEWELKQTFFRSNTCKNCKTIMKLNPLPLASRQHLLMSLEDLTSTSFHRKKQFEQFKSEMAGKDDIDVIVDGANVGFTNANRKANRSNVYLNASNIDLIVKELQEQNLHPYVILHHYHINHLLKTNPSEVEVLEDLRRRDLLYYVREGSNDDWYWLYLALSNPNRYILSNDQMRDHLFHAEKDEMLFRQFREESQISFYIPPVLKQNTRVQFTFPKPYSLCIQEGKNGFHLPFGHMEKSSFRLEKWYCLQKCVKTVSKVTKHL